MAFFIFACACRFVSCVSQSPKGVSQLKKGYALITLWNTSQWVQVNGFLLSGQGASPFSQDFASSDISDPEVLLWGWSKDILSCKNVTRVRLDLVTIPGSITSWLSTATPCPPPTGSLGAGFQIFSSPSNSSSREDPNPQITVEEAPPCSQAATIQPPMDSNPIQRDPLPWPIAKWQIGSTHHPQSRHQVNLKFWALPLKFHNI